MKEKEILVTVILSILLISSSGLEVDTEAHWAVEVGDRYDFRVQYLLCNRSLDSAEREMEFDETLCMEITDLGNLSLPHYGWIPTDYYSRCRNILAFPNGTDVYHTEHLLVLGSGFSSSAAMPVGNWSGATEQLQELNTSVSSYNQSYEVVEDAVSWGYTWKINNINLIDTRIYSKTDGALLSIYIINGINERIPSIDLGYDVIFERLQTSNPFDMIITVGSIAAVAIVIGLIVLVKKRGS